jgi:hypothetical protein
VFYEGSNIETNSRTLFYVSLRKFSPPEVALSLLRFQEDRVPTHTNKGHGQFKHPSLVSFEYELPSALRPLLSFFIIFLLHEFEMESQGWRLAQSGAYGRDAKRLRFR